MLVAGLTKSKLFLPSPDELLLPPCFFGIIFLGSWFYISKKLKMQYTMSFIFFPFTRVNDFLEFIKKATNIAKNIRVDFLI